MLAVSTDRHDEVVVVHASGEVDAMTAPVLRDALTQAIDAGDVNLVADLSEVTFMDSTGLGVLVGRLKALRSQDGHLQCVVVEDRVRRVFMATGLDSVLPLFEDVQSAVQAARATKAADPA